MESVGKGERGKEEEEESEKTNEWVQDRLLEVLCIVTSIAYQERKRENQSLFP